MNIYCLLLILASHTVTFTRQMEQLQVRLLKPEVPVVQIKADTGCDGQMFVTGCMCSKENTCYDMFDEGSCQEEGQNYCLPSRLAKEQCAVIKGKKGKREYRSAELNLTDVIFYKGSSPNASNWEQHGTTSELRLTPLAGVPKYKIKLEDANKHKNVSCQELELTGNTTESPGSVIFRVHWHQEVMPGCTYKVEIIPMTQCNTNLDINYRYLDNLQYKPIELEPMSKKISAATVGISSFLVVVVVVLLLQLFLKLKQARQRPIPCMPEESTPLTPCQSVPSPPPKVLLVYPFNLQPQMAAIATRLKELTSLQIEDLYDVGDQDKLNDPTVWLTRRLMDANTYFVLAGSPALSPDNKESSEERHESVVHFLHGHFLQHLHSSSLAYDYKRLHVVRFDDESQGDVSDVTPGRLYQLPDHLSQLVHNLTLGTAATTTTATA